jgi:fermentation-respiration switch protein FrsA (DUF1100 family)
MFYLVLALLVPLIIITLAAYLGSNYLMARRKPDPPASPADYGLTFEEVEFHSGDGTVIRGWYVPAQSASAPRTVVICPGANGSMDNDAPVLAWFHILDMNVLIFDWRAHGRSDGELVTLGYDERYDLIAAVEYARSRGAARIGVLGFSMGGAVALATAAGFANIHAVVADGAFVHVVSAVAGGLSERGLPVGLSYAVARLLLIAMGARSGRNIFDVDPVRWIGQIAPRPTLLMYGGRDPFASRAEVDLLYWRAGQPKELWRVPEASHRDIQTYRAEEYRRRIEQFFVNNL